MEETKKNRITELAHLAKERELTEAECAEQKALRSEYIEEYKRGLKQSIESIVLVDEQGNRSKIRKKK
jgi:uncharacterized protein YnzC (UPF0291/DUF896 family)